MDKPIFSSDFKLAIIGGGQLGKMMLYETRKWDIYTKVLDPNPEAPCKIACNEFVQGDLQNYQDVMDFCLDADVITIEIEAVNVAALSDLKEQGKKVYPQPECLKIIQNKISQKEFYKVQQLPTADFKAFVSKKELSAALEKQTINFPFVWKSATGGYDGRGVQVVKNQQQIEELPDQSCLVDDLIDFSHELSVIVARNESGEIRSYPVVEMEFHSTANQVEFVITPARIDQNLQSKAKKLAEEVAQKMGIIGLLAVELFLTKDHQLLINEVAPRPHNSGHVSIEANYTNQFEQYLRAILNLPLGATELKTAAVMVNLVGAENHRGLPVYQNMDQLLQMPGVTPHIYGKKQTRPFRKMGHVTIIDEDVDHARENAALVKSKIKIISHD
jgi:5-(carboxyamino)imidazole ribonucleotide synthase